MLTAGPVPRTFYLLFRISHLCRSKAQQSLGLLFPLDCGGVGWGGAGVQWADEMGSGLTVVDAWCTASARQRGMETDFWLC